MNAPRRHPHAASTQGRGSVRARIRRAFATRGASLASSGTGAPSTSLGTPSPQITKAEQAHLPAGVGPRRRASLGFASVLAVAALISLGAAPALAAPPAQFGSEGTGAGQISASPTGLAIDQQSGAVYVADSGNNRIDKFDSEGKFLLAFGWGVADGSSEALQTCTTICFSGLKGPGVGQFNFVEGIAVDNNPLSPSRGDLYVLDSSNRRVQKFGPGGEFLLTFGGGVDQGPNHPGNLCTAAFIAAGDTCGAGLEGAGPGQFEFLTGRSIGVGPTGNVYVGDQNRVQLFGEGGGVEAQIALPEAERIDQLAVDSAGNFYLKVRELPGVRKYEPTTPTGTELGSPRDQAGVPGPIAIGPSDQLFVNDGSAGHHLLSYDPAGKQLASFDAGGEAQNGRAIAYSEVTEALYVLNAGAVRIVTPPPPGPFVLPGSEAATEIRPTAATLGAQVNPEGGAETKCRFQYVDAESFTKEGGFASPNTEQTTPTELTGGEFEDQPVSAPISPLQPRTTYHFRVLCENAAAETSTGPDQEFTTLPPVSIDSTSATDVTATSATLETELNPHGLPTTYHFEYDTAPYAEGEPPHGTPVPFPDASAGSGTVDVLRAVQLQGLEPSTTYHFRVLATNSLGTSEGPDRSFTTQGAAASLLPDGRQWEMVSPPNKHGAPLEPLTEEGGVIQAAADGSGLTYVALGPLGPESEGVRSPTNNQWLSKRGPAGFTTRDITTPHEEINIIKAGEPSEYNLFADDLSASVVTPAGYTPLSAQTTERTPYRREADGEYVPLVTAANVPAETKFASEVFFRTATPDLSHTLLSSSQVLAGGFKAGFEPEGRANLYELAGGSLTLVSVLPSGQPAAEAGLSVGVGLNGLNMRGAISNDGSRVVFSTDLGEQGHLYTRDVGLGQTVQLDELQPGAAGGVGRATFQGASSDGSKVFFTDASGLTSDSTVKHTQPDLYMCEITVSAGQLSCALSDLSIDHNPGEAANMNGTVSAIDASGSHAYFAASGVLTNSPNSRGEHAVPGDCDELFRHAEAPCNLYAYDTDSHQISLVAVLSSHDDPNWGGSTNLHDLGDLTARSSPNGRYLTFMSQRSLTGYDNRDAGSGQPDAEVYLYDSGDGALRCVSCNPTGARPDGVRAPTPEEYPGLLVDYPDSWRSVAGDTERWLAASIPGWTLQSLQTALYQSRYLSDSGRLFFTAADALVPTDTNGVMDVYQYEPPGVGDCTESSPTYGQDSGGCVSLISSGTSPEESAFLDASESGADVFFLTASKLASTDVDNAFDVYDAHACSVASPCTPPPPPPLPACEGDACQNPATPPVDATPGSLSFNGAGNVVQCPKAKVRKGGKCVARKHKKHHKKHHKKAHNRTGSNRGGQR